MNNEKKIIFVYEEDHKLFSVLKATWEEKSLADVVRRIIEEWECDASQKGGNNGR